MKRICPDDRKTLDNQDHAVMIPISEIKEPTAVSDCQTNTAREHCSTLSVVSQDAGFSVSLSHQLHLSLLPLLSAREPLVHSRNRCGDVCDLIRECRRHRGHQRDRAVKTSLSVPEKPVAVECVSVGGGAVLGDPSIPRRLLVFPFLLSHQVQDAWNVGGVSVGGDVGLTQGHSEWTHLYCLIGGRVSIKILQLI
ncbi:hypothetical protein Pcinc_017419 [Petrolisthes cinctipes]|uniref:Uncharacterized protein n=1 Tax=Petrolisthes cinctipes TaxID=88211 RepID=A0AAE1FQ70_PETCI|nr:hypothetical protein Pcinc_017419 [Petrolisthes cinctipes]